MNQYIGMRLGVYQIIEQIGQGGMATVFKAYQPSMDRYVAVKILPSHFTQDESFVGRFTQEARTLARLQHPHILPVHDYGEQDGITYLVMRYIEGGTLKDIVNRQGAMELKEAARVLGQVGHALDYAHSHGVVHRDIKPGNVLIDSQGNTFLTDFGIAKLVAETAQFTASGAIIGTPAYMSPEQGLGQPADYRSDIYSLGVVLYELVTGQVPFEAETPMAVLLKHINSPLPLPRQVKPDLPEAVERVILKAMAKEPGERFESARALSEELDKVVKGDPTRVVAPAAPAKETVALTEFADAAPAHPEGAAPARNWKRWLLPVGGAALLILALAIGLPLLLLNGGGGGTSTTAGQGSPGWTSYGNSNFIFALARQDETLWAGGEHGLVGWDLGDGTYVRLGMADGLASNYINDLLVDREGVLWIATDAGINSYDGESMTTYDEGDGLDSDAVQVLFMDDAGRLWAGTRGGERGLNGYDGGAWGRTVIPDLPLESPGVRALGGSGETLVAGTNDQGLALFDGEDWTVMTTSDGLPSNDVLAVIQTDDELWVSFDESTVWIDLETTDVEQLLETGAQTIFRAADGDIWFGGEFRAYRFDPASEEWEEFETDPGPIPGRGVNDILEDENGLWFGTYGGGAALFDGSSWESWATEEELGGNWIEAIRQDGQGALWFTHPGTGLSRYEPDRDTLQIWDEENGAPDWPSIPAVDSAGSLWIGGYSTLLRQDGQGWERLTPPELDDVDIYAISIGPNDVQWLVIEGGLIRHDPAADAWETFTEDDHPIIEDIRAILAASDGSVYLAGEEGFVRYDGSDWGLPEASGSTPEYVDDIEEAPDGSLWVATDGRLAHLADGEWSYYSWPAEGYLNEVAIGPDGDVWAGYEGLGRYDPSSGDWEMYTTADGLVQSIVEAIHVTPEGVVWIGTMGGISRFGPPD